jgi:hypothetical protein
MPASTPIQLLQAIAQSFVQGTDNNSQDDQQSSATTWYESAGQDSGSVRSQGSFTTGQDGGSVRSQSSFVTARGDSMTAESLGDADEFASLRSAGSGGSFVSASGSFHSNASPSTTSPNLRTAR